MRSERIVVVCILSFIVLLASFGVVSALLIIALEKKSDVRTLWSMGGSDKDLRKIFFKNGILIVSTGWLSGLFLGIAIIALQKWIGIVPLGLRIRSRILSSKSKMAALSSYKSHCFGHR